MISDADKLDYRDSPSPSPVLIWMSKLGMDSEVIFKVSRYTSLEILLME